MSFIDTLKAFLGFTGTKETVENIVVQTTPEVETPAPTPEPVVRTPIEESPEEKIVISEPVVDTMETDVSAETPVMETPAVDTTTTTENQ